MIHRWRWLDSATGSRFDGTLLCVSAPGTVLDRVKLGDELALIARLASCGPSSEPLHRLLSDVMALGRPAHCLDAEALGGFGGLLGQSDGEIWRGLMTAAEGAAGPWAAVTRWRQGWLLANVDNDHCREILGRVLSLARRALAENGSLRLERGAGGDRPDPTVIHLAR